MIYFRFRTWESILHSSVSPCSGHTAPRLIRQPCAEELQIILAPGRFRPLLWYYANVKPQKLWQRLQSSKAPRAPPASLIATLKLMPLLSPFPFSPQICLSFRHPCTQTTCAPPPLQPDPVLWAVCSFWEWLLLADVRWVEVEEVAVPLAGVSESLSRLLEPFLVHAKQEWQQDSAKEVSPFTRVPWLQWGQQIMQTDTHALIK